MYYKRSGAGTGYRHICIACYRMATLTQCYDITSDDVDAMIIEQSNCCSICEISFEQKQFVVDHDHKTNRVRGLLCQNCNLALGHMQDNSQRFERAIQYLHKRSPNMQSISPGG